MIRSIMRSSGLLPTLKKLRQTPTDLQRLFRAVGLSELIAKSLTTAESLQFEADLSAFGIAPGKTSGTLPERLIFKYLYEKAKLPYEGISYQARLNRGFAFQLPVGGGRSASGGGAVADLAVAASQTYSKKTLLIFADGSYWHLGVGKQASDAAQEKRLKAQGYDVQHILDTQIYNPGQLDSFMRTYIRF